MYPDAEEHTYQLGEAGPRGPDSRLLMPDPQKIVILRALYLGDLLLATPAWRALRRRFPAAEITLIGLPWAEQLLPHVPGLIDRLLIFPGHPGLPERPYSPERSAAFLAEQRAYGYDLAIQMHGDGRASNAFVAALGARTTLGLSHTDTSPLDITLPYHPPTPASRLPAPASRLPPPASQPPPPASQTPPPASRLPAPASRLPPPSPRLPAPASQPPPPASRLPAPASQTPPPSPRLPPPGEESELLRWLRLVAAVGAPAESTRIEFQIGQQSQARADQLLRGAGRPLVGMHVGARDPARRWPPARFAELGRELRRLAGATLVLSGTSDEHSLTTLVGKQLGPPLIDLVGCTALGDLAALIARLDLLVTNDTGASHLAAAVGTPSVVLFGPARPARYAPLNTALHYPIDALEHLPAAADGAAALAALPVAPVLAAALRQLPGGEQTREVGV